MTTVWGPSLRIGSPHQPKTLTDVTLERLRQDIVAGRLKSGVKIKSEDLKALYGVGTSPVREALFQLAGEGLVRVDGQKGFRVAELNENELIDVTDWRARLEGEALRRSIANGDLNWEANAIAALHKLKGIQSSTDFTKGKAADLWERQHSEFHFALYSKCGSPWLLRFCELLIQNGERYRRCFVEYRSIDPSITEEHEALLDAAVKRDVEKAVAILEKHIRHAENLAQKHALSAARSGSPKNSKKTNKKR